MKSWWANFLCCGTGSVVISVVLDDVSVGSLEFIDVLLDVSMWAIVLFFCSLPDRILMSGTNCMNGLLADALLQHQLKFVIYYIWLTICGIACVSCPP
jgi:hypothetical protein